MPEIVYLDTNASTPCDPAVLEQMLPFLGRECGNPASLSHRPGQRAAAALDDARARVAHAVGAASAAEITFTSGATEANNLAIAGVAEAAGTAGRHLVTQATEHPSVLEPMRRLAAGGCALTVIGVDRRGRVRLDELEAALRPATVLVSLMLANNETGTIQPVREAAALVRSHGALLHCDAAQGPGKLALDVVELGVDLLTVSAHKAYGPKGAGALYRSRRARRSGLRPCLVGGGQEDGLRAGTPNLPGAVGLAAALELAAARLAEDAARQCALRDLLERRLLERLDGCSVNGDPERRLPNTTNLSFDGVEGSALLASLVSSVAVSTGSACSATLPEPSPVLLAMGLPPALAAASLRFSVGRQTTEEEVEHAVEHVVHEVDRLRRLHARRR